MVRKNSRTARSKINLHEVAKLSPEEIDCLLNPNEDIDGNLGCEKTHPQNSVLVNSSYAKHFASALSFCLSTQFDTVVSVEVAQTCLCNFRHALKPKYSGFTKLLFQNSQDEVISALLISHGFLESTLGSEIVSRSEDAALGDFLVVNFDTILAFKSFSAFMGKGVELVSELLARNPETLNLSDGDILKIDLQMTSSSSMYPAIGLISPVSQ